MAKPKNKKNEKEPEVEVQEIKEKNTVQKETVQEKATDEKRPELTYANANKYIIYAFEQSEYFTKDMTEANKEKAFRNFVNDKL